MLRDHGPRQIPGSWHVTRIDDDRVPHLSRHGSHKRSGSIEAGVRRYYQEMADGTFVELSVPAGQD